jgi:tyramine---L-glutamate ligase
MMFMQSSPLRILVHEFVTGGGWQGAELHPGLAAEGLAMLQAALSDFQSWGRAHLVTTLDHRLTGLPLAAHRVVSLSHEAYLQALTELAAQVDAALIIAPESEGILTRLSALMEETGTQLLGSGSLGVAIASDKWDCFLRFKESGLPTPNTWRTNRAEASAVAGELGFPLVVKPIAGAGCEAVSLASDPCSLKMALDMLDPMDKDLLMQQYVAGTHASVSLLACRAGVLPLSLNEQRVSIGTPFQYQGGAIPLQHRQQHLAMDYARRAVSLVPGLKGYIGVDLVLAEDQCFVIEINPRLTTSYVGLRQVININLAEAIWHACVEDTLPQGVMLSGEVSFRKEEFSVIQHA